MLAALPIVIVMTLAAVFLLCRRIPNDIDNIQAATRMLDRRVRTLGAMSARERKLAILGLLTIVAWITVGHPWLAVIAMVSAVMLFVLRIVAWNAVQGYVNWGVLIMYGGAVALGSALSETRAMEWLVHQVIDPTAPKLLVLMVMVATTILLTEGISNAAAVAILLPIGYSLGDAIGVGPVMITLVITIPAGLAFMLPVSSPPNAISFSAGHYSVREAVSVGWPLSLTALIVLLIVIVAYWEPVLHLSSW